MKGRHRGGTGFECSIKASGVIVVSIFIILRLSIEDWPGFFLCVFDGLGCGWIPDMVQLRTKTVTGYKYQP